MIAAATIGALACVSAHAQQPVSEKAAADYIYGGFLTDAAHAILSPNVRISPDLRQRLSLPSDADSRRIYDALVKLTDKKTLVVRKASAGELSRFAGGDPKQPLFVLEAGNTRLLIQYDLVANNIPFVGLLYGTEEPAFARKPVSPAPATPLRPTGPCVVRPVMSDQDLANCAATPR